MKKHVFMREQAICETSFFVESVDEVTQAAFRSVDCVACLLQALAASETRTRAIRDLLAKLEDESCPRR